MYWGAYTGFSRVDGNKDSGLNKMFKYIGARVWFFWQILGCRMHSCSSGVLYIEEK